ncbi:MAG: MFS transporter [Neomegalonema sp.]|nr:MFS transporter [Neomegalonema sp.]
MAAIDETSAAERPTAQTYRNVAALFSAQALLSGQIVINMTFGPLVGLTLASDPSWATAPISVMVLANMICAAPVSALLARVGRRPGFLIGALFGAAGGALGAYAIVIGSFALFLAATACLGVYQAHQNFFRFAATDTSPDSFKPTAVSLVLGGGLVAAFIGPAVGSEFRDALDPYPLAGAYAAIVGINLIGAIPLLALDIPRPPRPKPGQRAGRPLREILRDPVIRVAILCGMVSYGLMSLVMTAASIAVVGCGHGEAAASAVIGAHVFAMFAPSFFTGMLIKRFGHNVIIAIGLALLAGCGLVAISGVELEKFFIALVLLGVGWNFGFIGATSLLTTAHAPEERGRIQGFNDLCVFGLVAMASLSSGKLMHGLGWEAVNYAMVPFLCVAAAALIWLTLTNPRAARHGATR